MDYKTNELFKFDKIIEKKQYELLQYQTDIKKNSSCIPVIYYFTTRKYTRNINRYKNFVDYFNTIEDNYFLELLKSYDYETLRELRLGLSNYLYILKHNEFMRDEITDLFTLKETLYKFLEDEKEKFNIFVEPLLERENVLGFIGYCDTIEYNKKVRRLNKYANFIRNVKDDVLIFILNKKYSTLLKYRRDLNEYLIIKKFL